MGISNEERSALIEWFELEHKAKLEKHWDKTIIIAILAGVIALGGTIYSSNKNSSTQLLIVEKQIELEKFKIKNSVKGGDKK